MKILSRMLLAGGILASASALNPLVFSSDAHAYVCKGTQYGAASTKRIKGVAKTSARKKWEATMKNQFGYSWSVWSIAAGKTVECHKTGARHTCHALARPCQYVVQ
ncbi:MAG: hypothetical protein NXI27_28195 [Alphaproteobacteria bacterium]|nr:hypothetical protein [Alphaproteobacteria bacterium]